MGSKSPPIRFEFDEEAATAAAAVLLKLAGGRMKYLKLIKLLYIAERESLRRYGRPICGDNYVAMPKGPVLSTVLNLIKEPNDDYWRRFIQTGDAHTVELVADPGEGALSDAETKLLRGVFEEFGKRNRWDLVEMTHREFPEWRDPHGSSRKIHPEEVLLALGKSPDEIQEIALETFEANALETLLRRR